MIELAGDFVGFFYLKILNIKKKSLEALLIFLGLGANGIGVDFTEFYDPQFHAVYIFTSTGLALGQSFSTA